MTRALCNLLVLLVAAALALAPRTTNREEDTHPAASEAGSGLRQGVLHVRPGPDAALPSVPTPGM